MTDDEIIAVITHRKNGGEVEWRFVGRNDSWKPKNSAISWDFTRFEYRPKPVDRVLYYTSHFLHLFGRPDSISGDVAITFDAESGEPKKLRW